MGDCNTRNRDGYYAGEGQPRVTTEAQREQERRDQATDLLQQPSHFYFHLLDYPPRIRDMRGGVLHRKIVLRLSIPNKISNEVNDKHDPANRIGKVNRMSV